LLFLKVCQQMWDPFKVPFHKAKLAFQHPLARFVIPDTGNVSHLWLRKGKNWTWFRPRPGRPTNPEIATQVRELTE
jgi:hypothetical protein